MKHYVPLCIVMILILVPNACADFSKSVDKNSAIVGDRLNYTIYPEYAGSSLLTTARVSDVMPSYTTYITGSANASGSYSSSTKKITWTLGTTTARVIGKTSITPNTKTITASTDTYISQSSPTSNYGSLTYLYGQNATNAIKRMLINFAITGIDSSAKVTGASLKLYDSVAVSGQLINIHRLTRSYTETGATWNKATSSVTWTNPGGDYDLKVWGSFEATPVNTSINIPITDLVQSWINLSIPLNYGLLLNPTTASGQSTWNSRTATTNKTTLVINYNWPRYSTNTTISAEPLVICGKKNVTVIMTYNAAGSLVVIPPSTLTTTVTNGVTATLISGPTPSYSQPLNPGSSISVNYVYRVTAGNNPGTIKFSGKPSSVGTNDAFTSGTSNVVLVTPPLGFSVLLASSVPSSLSKIINSATLFDTIAIPSGIISSSAITDVPPSLKVEKTSAPTQGSPGASIDFTITVKNTGNSSLDPIEVVDVLPTGLTYISDKRFLVGNLNVENNVDTNSAGMAEAFSYTSIASGTANTLNLYLDSTNTAVNIMVGVYAGSTHPTTLLSSGSLTNPTAGAWNAIPLSPIAITSGTKYWLVVLNPAGGQGAIKFRDGSSSGTEVSSQTNLISLPNTWSTGTTYSSNPMSAYLTSTSSGAVVGKTITWANVGPLSSGSSTSIDLVALIDGAKLGTLTNNINATGTPPTGNDVFSQTTAIVQALNPAVSITKTASPNQGSPGTNVDFGIKVTNTGNVTLNTVKVVDVLPSGLTYVSDNRTCNAVGKTITWTNVGPLNSGSSTSISLVASIDGSETGILTNNVNVTGKPPTGNDVISQTIATVQALFNPAVSITKAASPNQGSPGSIITFGIKVSNTGNIILNTVKVVDVLPAGLTYISDNRTGSAVGKTITWTNVGPLNAGSSIFIGLTASIDGSKLGDLTNNVNVAGTPPTGSNVTSEDSEVVAAFFSAFEVRKTADKNEAGPSSMINYTIKVKNTGNDTLSEVEILDIIPDGIRYISDNRSGQLSGNNITWHIGPLEPGNSSFIEVVGIVL